MTTALTLIAHRVFNRKPRKTAAFIFAVLLCYLLYKWTIPSTIPTQPFLTTHRKVFSLPAQEPLKQWLIVQLTEHPEICTRLAMSFPGWTIALVGVKSFSDHSHSRCRYFSSQDAQDFWNSNRMTLLGENNPSLLQVAYLQAVKEKADVIYLPDANLDLRELSMPSIAHPQSSFQGLTYIPESGHYFDPNVHFGCNISSAYLPSEQSTIYKLCTFPQSPVIQTPAIVGPLQLVIAQDFSDALLQENIRYCDSYAPPVLLHPGTFAPMHFNNSAFLYDAFWALPFQFELSIWDDLQWSFILQRLIGLTGSNNQTNSVLVHFQGIQDKIPPAIAIKTESVRVKLLEFRCNVDSFVDCASNLLSDLSNEKFIENSTVESFLKWLKMLQMMGYRFPSIIHQGLSSSIDCSEEHIKFHPLNFSTAMITKPYLPKPMLPVSNLDFISQLYHSTCDSVKIPSANNIDFARPRVQYSEILLLVIFNGPVYAALPYFEALYRSFFPNIVYCGPGHPNYQILQNFKQLKISFISYHKSPKGHVEGALNYECLSIAMKMNYNVQGYLTIADDMVLSLSSIKNHTDHFDSVWYLSKDDIRIGEITRLRECHLGKCDVPTDWAWWGKYIVSVIKLFDYFDNNEHNSTLIRDCYQQLKLLNGAERRPNGGYSDVFYIPKRLASPFSQLADIFFNFQVFFEIAVPTIIQCLEFPDEFQTLKGLKLWGKNRTSLGLYFTPQDMMGMNFIHPTKWKSLSFGEKNKVKFYCNKVMPFMHDHN
ncbi:hypothetical protein CAPTEDRAFT_204969 [Capitella teleta]|uniref:Uncharacterized protein n=1 Tax=Capitella teleta TaxID=283909 RepID=R7TWV6_CAPTE|nr:hypothetical protein CAPTEDRAFT_204969 [Capitella teleta]|eukprot:ELT98388.1 hypothetical protein CAPTEDRAFT_204969 [Capitella teleta]